MEKYKIYKSKYFGIAPKAVNPKYIYLDEKMQLGYKNESLDNKKKAVDIWIDLFNDIIKEMDKISCKSIKEFDEIFIGNEYVSNWISDFDDLFDILLSTLSEKKIIKKYGEIRIKINEKIQEFADDDALKTSKRAIAYTHLYMGNKVKSIMLFEEYLALEPTWGLGWLFYADMYFFNDGYRDLEKAEKILLRARKIKNIQDIEFIEDRLLNIYEESENFKKLDKLQNELDIKAASILKEESKYSNEINELMSEYRAIAANKEQSPKIEFIRKTGRNDKCPCGSGKKYKKCCMNKNDM